MTKRGYLATSDVARICQVTAVTVGNWIRSGKLAASRVPGGNYRISAEALVRFLKQAGIPAPPRLTHTQPRVLIIEHDPDIVRRISDILVDTHRMWNIDTAADCFTAGAKIIENEPDLVILDVLMPGIDPDVCKQIKQTSAWKRAKVIAFADHSQPAGLAKVQIIGPDCCLDADFTAEELRSAVFGLLFGKGPPPDANDTDPQSPP